MIRATHSCGDCGFTGDYQQYEAHLQRNWHQRVMKFGLHEALKDNEPIDVDSARAVHIFVNGGTP